MAIDRDATLKKAEKLLRQGRLEPAIAEYVRVVEEHPRDWSTANTLGELYARAGQPQNAVVQYTRIAQHFVDEGFYPKAAALYKKILKIKPHDETTQMQLAEISARQGLLADAKAHLNAIADAPPRQGRSAGRRRNRRPARHLDPADFDARLAAARTLEEMGEEEEARQALQGAARRPARKGPNRGRDRRAQAVRPHQPARARGRDRYSPRRRSSRATSPEPVSFSTRTAPADDQNSCCRWRRSSCDPADLDARAEASSRGSWQPTRRSVRPSSSSAGRSSSRIRRRRSPASTPAVDAAIGRVGIPGGGDESAGVRRRGRRDRFPRSSSSSKSASTAGSSRRCTRRRSC